MNKPSSTHKTLALIPARGNSKRLPGKNIRPLRGVPLIEYTIQAALGSSYIHRVVVSTDDDRIAEVALKAGASVIRRPADLASDTASSADVVVHALDLLEKDGESFSRFVLLQPTSPLRTKTHLDACFKSFENGDFKSAISVCPLKLPLHQCFAESASNLLQPLTDLQPASPDRIVRPNGAIYIADAQEFRNLKRFHLHPCLSFSMSEMESVDIDTLEDFRLCEAIFDSRRSD